MPVVSLDSVVQKFGYIEFCKDFTVFEIVRLVKNKPIIRIFRNFQLFSLVGSTIEKVLF